MAEKPPAFQFYVKAWMSSTAHMSLEAQGAYARLMAWSWDNGPLPTAEAARARLVGLTTARFRKVWAEFSAKWLHTSDGLVNLRLEQQRADLEAHRLQQSQAGKASAAKRQREANEKSTESQRPLQREGQRKGNSSSSSSPSEDQIKTVSPEPLRDSSPTVLTFPTAGAAKSWDLDEQQIANWQELYQGVDVLAECRKGLAWVMAKPNRKKTAKGMPAFLVGWLNKATDQPARSGHRATPRRLGPSDEGYYDQIGKVS